MFGVFVLGAVAGAAAENLGVPAGAMVGASADCARFGAGPVGAAQEEGWRGPTGRGWGGEKGTRGWEGVG